MSNYNEQLQIYNATKEAQNGKPINYRVLERGLKQRLADGEITKNDVAVAYDVAKQLQSNQTRVLYASIKKQAELNEVNKPEEQAEQIIEDTATETEVK